MIYPNGNIIGFYNFENLAAEATNIIGDLLNEVYTQQDSIMIIPRNLIIIAIEIIFELNYCNQYYRNDETTVS